MFPTVSELGLLSLLKDIGIVIHLIVRIIDGNSDTVANALQRPICTRFRNRPIDHSRDAVNGCGNCDKRAEGEQRSGYGSALVFFQLAADQHTNRASHGGRRNRHCRGKERAIDNFRGFFVVYHVSSVFNSWLVPIGPEIPGTNRLSIDLREDTSPHTISKWPLRISP